MNPHRLTRLRSRPMSAALACLLSALMVATTGTAAVPARPAAAAARSAGPASASSVADSGPRSRDFDQGWRFALVNPAGITDPTGAYANAQAPDFDDSSWRRVTVPHDWSIELDPTNAPGASTNAGTGFLQGGLGWYRKTFTLPPSMAGKKVSVEFDGVYMDSSVYLNGQLVANHPYGYTGFNVDLTPLAHTDRTPNVIAVKVQNQLPSSRWYSGSGIYRNVHLVVTDPVHVVRYGTFVTTPNLETTYPSGSATVHIDTTAVNEGGGTWQGTVVNTVRDARGRVVGRQESPVALGAGQQASGADIRVSRPTLWSTSNPYLYTLRTDLVAGDRTVDSTSTAFGVRWFSLDADKGFSLNGEPMKLQGVDLHHTLGPLGAAVSYDATLKQMQIMKGMGVNALRTAHNPPSPEQLDVCQRLGILVIDEAFDTWRRPKVRFDYGRFFDANADADVAEMVHAAKNSPSVIMWSIGNEIPDSTSVPVGVPIATRLIADVRSIDPTRPVVMGSDKYRTVPADGSAQDQILRLLDGMGLNYNTAASVDGLHAKYPDKFFFESESSSSTSTRGVYRDPDQLNTGENYTPGRMGASSYDNNLAPWTMSAEYGLKKDRDRAYFLGEFLWSGQDYLGEPTPFGNNFPVKASFFGAVDTAGLPKDEYHLFRSQWTAAPMVHLLPMNWTDHEPGEPVQVWAYSNVDTVELFLNGRSLGVRRFDHKTTTDGRGYLETTEATGDDKGVTSGPYPGSYTSSNGSAGKLHLSWDVPFSPGRLVAVAKTNGTVVARDEVATTGRADAIRLSPDRRVVAADGRSLTYVTVDIVDSRGLTVPGAGNLVSFTVRGGQLAAVDNGRQESAENYQAPSHEAFNGKAVAIVRSGSSAGPIRITATSPGLRPATTTVRATTAPGGDRVATEPSPPSTADPADGPAGPTADASFSGTADTVPAAMLDGDPAAGGWSNFYLKPATALLPPISRAEPSDWVSLSWPDPQRLDTLTAYFTTDATHALPASIEVSYWNGATYVPVRHPQVAWATESNQPTTITFDRVATRRIKLDLTSQYPKAPNGFLQIAELRAAGAG